MCAEVPEAEAGAEVAEAGADGPGRRYRGGRGRAGRSVIRPGEVRLQGGAGCEEHATQNWACAGGQLPESCHGSLRTMWGNHGIGSITNGPQKGLTQLEGRKNGENATAAGLLSFVGTSAHASPAHWIDVHTFHERSPMEDRKQAALDYHEFPTPGKISVIATKQLINQSDLALAYSPGVAAACEAIVQDPLAVFRYTARGNLVGVISNGTAVLGLGAIGPLAAKPVMEGKAVLFKKFAGIDVFDIEIEQRDPQQADRGHRRPRAHFRRHQSRRHQSARMLHRRAGTAQADEDPGIPR